MAKPEGDRSTSTPVSPGPSSSPARRAGDLYLAFARPVSKGIERPAVLVHRHSKQPEYSGWYAYASEQDEHSDDLVVWSMKDLVDHSPEAARPLREGHGEWK